MIAAPGVSASDRRKRLGQFLSGDRLARLLASLARAAEARTAIDPMAGSGDMLAACLGAGTASLSLAGIEIDPYIAEVCRARLERSAPSFTMIDGNAFDPSSWETLSPAFDLVITNPPYVRYQLGSNAMASGVEIPSAAEIRAALVACLARTENLQPSERAAFTDIAKRYSGLADLAVPSWILCCARVVIGGRLAVVVPNTWLSRDYAAPVLYLLRRFFDIEYVVEDADVTWFPQALARTTLVVARRVGDKGSPHGPGGHLHLSLPGSLADSHSLVGTLFPHTGDPDHEFAKWAASRHAEKASGQLGDLCYAWSNEQDFRRDLRYAAKRQAWLNMGHLAEDVTSLVPEQIQRLLNSHPLNLVSLESLGWKIGQGLRTGANDFFYVSKHPSGVGFCSALLPGQRLDLPKEALRAAVRRQAELPSEPGGGVEQPNSYILVLSDWALPEDMRAARGPRPWREMKADLARLVRTAANKSYQRRGSDVRLCDLTAVRTNTRDGEGSKPARFWYQLPALADRHTPDIYLARVNSGLPKPHLNPGRLLVIDANFSTLWATCPDALGIHEMWVLLSSSWTQSFLEASATVLGGGALKIEATHLRRLLVPAPCDASSKSLSELTDIWSSRSPQAEVLSRIDDVVNAMLACGELGSSLTDFALDRLRRRTGALAGAVAREG